MRQLRILSAILCFLVFSARCSVVEITAIIKHQFCRLPLHRSPGTLRSHTQLRKDLIKCFDTCDSNTKSMSDQSNR
jgi:hypothetical protein